MDINTQNNTILKVLFNIDDVCWPALYVKHYIIDIEKEILNVFLIYLNKNIDSRLVFSFSYCKWSGYQVCPQRFFAHAFCTQVFP